MTEQAKSKKRGGRRRRGRRSGGKPPAAKQPRGGANGSSAPGLIDPTAASGEPQGRRRNGKRRRGRSGGRGRGGGPRPTGARQRPQGEATAEVRGVLQVGDDGNGFLRCATNDYNIEPGDPFVPRAAIAELKLETGIELEGRAIPGRSEREGAWLDSVTAINGAPVEQWQAHTPFKDLVAEAPSERIRLETSSEETSMRVVDLITPIGKGQRCLIVAPPKAGKTVLMQKMAGAISTNHPEIHLIVLLVDERPEEVTDMRRTVKGEVLASSSDELARNHLQVAEMVLERAKRLVESGRDVVVLLDSITRLSRAYNTEQRGSGRVLSGGIDARTMEKPRRFFGAARKAEGEGSLTVIGTALVDTGSRMDEVIFQEFKGTGNTEIVMDRALFDRRIFPAIDISQSGTRKEELLYSADEYKKVTLLRRALAPLRPAEAMQLLVGKLQQTRSNADFLASMSG